MNDVTINTTQPLAGTGSSPVAPGSSLSSPTNDKFKNLTNNSVLKDLKPVSQIVNMSQTLTSVKHPLTKIADGAKGALTATINNKFNMLINSGMLKNVKPLVLLEKKVDKLLGKAGIDLPAIIGETFGMFQANDGIPLYTRFGSLIFCNTILKTQDEKNNINLDCSVISVQYKKNIVKTKVAGRNGSFKEHISDDDYSITITGMLVNDNLQSYPIEIFKNFCKIIKKSEQLTVLNPILKILDVDTLVIENVSLSDCKGFENTQPFVISATSDTCAELEYSEQK